MVRTRVIPAADKANERMSGVRKAAIFVIGLGEEAGAAIIRQLSEDDQQLVSSEITRLHATIPHEQLEAVLEEFQERRASGDLAARGGADYANRVLTKALGPAPAVRLMDRIVRTSRRDEDIGTLQQADPQQLASFIQNEHPQTVALILANLRPAQAGSLLMSLPASMRPEVARRMASTEAASPEVFQRIAAVVSEKLKTAGELKNSGGSRMVAEILSGISSAAAKEIMAAIGETDSRVVAMIREHMFGFDDILDIPKENAKVLVSRIDRKVLTLALKGTSTEMKNHFLQCMSQRAAEMLSDDMEALGPQRIKDVEEAQQQIVAVVKQMQAEGVIGVKGAPDQYVV